MCNGEEVVASDGATLEHDTDRPGVWRAEAWFGDQLWVVTNPVYASA
jgi:hypothetical protein